MSDTEQATATEMTEEQKASEAQKAAVLAKLENIEPGHTSVEEKIFRFKETKDEQGNKIPARPPLTLFVPFPTFPGLVEGLSDERIQQYVVEILNESVMAAVRSQINDAQEAGNPITSQDQLDLNKLTLLALATMPKAERRGGGIAKETWEAFAMDYIDVMVNKLQTEKKKAEYAAALFLKRLQPVRTAKPVLTALGNRLDQWIIKTENADELKDCYEFLRGKIKVFLEMDETAMLDNI